MRNPGLWLVVSILVLLHLLLQVGLGVGGWVPDLLTVALLLGSREVRVGTGAAMGFVFGLMEDAFSLLAFGANTITLTLTGIVGARTRDLFVGDSVLFMMSYLALGTWLRTLLHWLVAGSTVRGPFVETLLLQGIPAALYAAVVGFGAVLVSGGWRVETPAR